LRSAVNAAIAIVAFLVSVAATQAGERTNVRVTIDPAGSGAIARFAFDRPVRAFRLSYIADDTRDRTWKITTPGLTRDGTLIANPDGAAFDAITVEIEARNDRTDAAYPCLFRAGPDGLVFYAGYFTGIEEEFTTTIEVSPADNRVVVGFPLGGTTWQVDAGFHRNTAHRYIYVGPPAYVSESRNARFVLPSDAAPTLRERIRGNVDGAIEFYARKVGRRLPIKPLIILAPNPDSANSGNQGDTTTGPTVALRLFGKRWLTLDPKSDNFDHLIAHEAAHFWNADTFHAAEGSPAWLWEGSAELWALDARIAVMRRLSAKGRRDHIEHALNACVSSLLDRPFTGHRSSATYVCGETLYWLADIAAKKRSKGRENIFTLWRQIFDKAESNGGIYTASEVFEHAAPTAEAKAAFAVFLDDEGYERWQTLPARLKLFGANVIAQPPTDETVRRTMIVHLLDLYCEGTRGMWQEDDHMKLDTGDHCGPLSGDPEIDTLNGHNLYSDLRAAHAALNDACKQNTGVTLTRTGKSDKLVAACAKPLPPSPPNFRIIATP
jgi:hypothetical protein